MIKLLSKIQFHTKIAWAFLLTFYGVYVLGLNAYAHNPFVVICSVFVLCLALALFFIAHKDILSGDKDLTKNDKVAVYLLFFAFLVTTISVLCYFVKYIVIGRYSWLTLTLILFLLLSSLTVYEFFAISRLKITLSNINYFKSSEFRQEIIFIAVIVAVMAILNLPSFSAWPRWDSYNYFYYVKRLGLECLLNTERLRIANHSAYICSFIYIILNGFFSDLLLTSYIANFLMLTVGAYCFYKIIRHICPRFSKITSLIFSLFYLVSPFTFGMSQNVNLDWFLIFAMVLFLYSEIDKNNLLRIFAIILICYSKEVGTPILAVIMASKLAITFIKNKKDLKISKFDPEFTIPVLVCGIVWFVDTLCNNWLRTNGVASTLTIDGSPFNSFGLSFTYVLDKIKCIFLTNFTWVVVILIALSLLVIFVKKVKLLDAVKNDVVFELIVALVISFALDLLFITYNHVRYNGIFTMLLLLTSIWLISKIDIKVSIKNTLGVMVSALFLIQCFVTIDPLMSIHMTKINSGNGSSYATQNNVLNVTEINNRHAVDLCDNVAYNKQPMFLDYAIDKAIASTRIGNETCYIISNEFYSQSLADVVNADYLIMGNGCEWYEDAVYVGWNGFTKSRRLTSDPNKKLNIYYINDGFSLDPYLKEYEYVYYFKMPFGDNLFDNLISLLPVCEHHYTATCNIWSIDVYKIGGVYEK